MTTANIAQNTTKRRSATNKKRRGPYRSSPVRPDERAFLISTIQRAVQTKGALPTQEDVRLGRYGLEALSRYRRTFRTFNLAVASAGYFPNRIRSNKDRRTFERLVKSARDNGIIPADTQDVGIVPSFAEPESMKSLISAIEEHLEISAKYLHQLKQKQESLQKLMV